MYRILRQPSNWFRNSHYIKLLKIKISNPSELPTAFNLQPSNPNSSHDNLLLYHYTYDWGYYLRGGDLLHIAIDADFLSVEGVVSMAMTLSIT
jgi:hypothetical protein